MNGKSLTIRITAGITVILLLIGGIGATSILLNTTLAQTATLGGPDFVQRGKSTVQKELGLTEHNILLLPMERLMVT